MEAGLDTGPVLLERRTPIAPHETGGNLHDRLARLGAEVLADGLARALRGELPRAIAQPESGVTYAHKIDKAEARIDWSEPAIAIERKVRAFDPWPVAEGLVEGERLRIWSAEALAQPAPGAPGSILAAERDALDIATGDGILRVRELQREGGRRMPVRDWLNARRESSR
jgi:methionyl-tRNA formyltransferase